jgi:hypothetical protein
MLLKPEFVIIRPPADMNVMFGCDPEVELLRLDGGFTPANVVMPNRGCSDEIGYDGSQVPAELRPRPGRNPKELIANLRPLIRRLTLIASTYRLYPSVAGHRMALGFHVHISWPSGAEVKDWAMVCQIDEEIGPCLAASGDGRGSYRTRLACREQRYDGSRRCGIEYRTPPGSFLFCPESAQSLIAAIAKKIAIPDSPRDFELAARFRDWNQWLREAVAKSHVLPVLWGRNWRARALAFAERTKLAEPPITRRPKHGPAKDLGIYEQIVQRFSGPLPSFEDVWSDVMREALVRALSMAPGKLIRASHWMTFFGLRQSRGDWIWSLPIAKEIVLEDGSRHYVRCPIDYSSHLPPRVGLAWNIRTITDPKLADRVAGFIVQSLMEVM